MNKPLAAVLAIGLTLTLAACKRELSAEERENARNGVLEYANNAGGKAGSCSGIDSDGDGYVTCSVTFPSFNGGRPEQKDLLCAYGSKGCKDKS